MTESELENLTIAESSARIKSGELSPVELTDLFLQRIARLNPSVNAYTTVLADSAKAEAKIAEQEIRSGNYRSRAAWHSNFHQGQSRNYRGSHHRRK